MQSTFIFQHFKPFAKLLLDHHLQTLTQTYSQLLKEVQAPLHQVFEKHPEEQHVNQIRKALENFLIQVLNDTALEEGYATIENWYSNQLNSFLGRQSRLAADLLLVHSARRQLFMQFIPTYTSDVRLAMEVMQELEKYMALLNQKAVEIFDELKQEELNNERKMLELVINNIVDGILVFDDEMRIVAFNRVLEKHNNLRQADLLGKKIFDIFPDREHAEEGQSFKKVLKGEHVYLRERPFKLKKGFFDLSIVPLPDKQGKIRGGVSIIHDISERKFQEDALREKSELLQNQKDELQAMVKELRASNEELHSTRAQLELLNFELENRIAERTKDLEYQRQWLYNLFMQVPGLIGILSGDDGTVVLFNQAFLDLWGGRQVLGMPMRQAWPELEGQGYFELLEEVMQTGKSIERHEYPGRIDRNNDGNLQQAYFNLVYSPFLNPKGETEGVIIYGVDVTEQVESRQKLEHSQQQLKLALEAGEMGIWDYDPMTDTSYHSPLYDKIFGYPQTPADWGYARFMEHVLPEQRPEVENRLRQAIETGRLHYDTKIKAADGTIRWITLSGQVKYNEENKPVRVTGVVMDITERKQAEEALKESHEELKRINTDLDNFIYTASHDLRSPILNLEGLVMMLQRKYETLIGEDDKNILNLMSTSIGRLKRTIDSLTDITRIQKEDKMLETIQLEDALQEVKQDISTELEDSGATLEVDFKEPAIVFASHNLRSILYNLLSNAIKYRNPQVPLNIQLQSYHSGNYTVLCIKDNGLGISEANQKKLFSMFKRFHTHVKGSGIGLYLIKRIIENAGGMVEAESTEGGGTTFRVYFPRYTTKKQS